MIQSGSESLHSVAGGCHCGAVRFEILVPETVKVSHCNCSICSMTGFIHLIVPKIRFKLLAGESELGEYRFNTRTARHYFCRTCGIKPFYVPRSHPDGYSVNLNCLPMPENVEITHTSFDGKNWRKNITGLLEKGLDGES